MSILSAKHFHDEAAAYEFVESRVWPDGPVCPHCKGQHRISKMQGKSTRIGTYKCYDCRKKFTVKVGTVMEDSHLSLRVWLQAFFLLSSSKKGISSNQLHRTLGITLKSAWFLSHRIREAMRSGDTLPLIGTVEVDETFLGKRKGESKKRGGFAHKLAVLSLVERGGEVRSFHIDSATASTITPIVNENVAREARLMTDDGAHYRKQFGEFKSHETVRHTLGEYVRGDVYSNSAENYFSIFKRGVKGNYQHISERHLHRYLNEFDFRYSNRIKLGINDVQRADRAIQGIVGKRLTYRQPTPKGKKD